jgi:indolepyruvate ferredoxin oxidoreductase beta subunit
VKVQILLAGIGGQGILFASKIFSEMGLKLGLGVMGSETHGMSQRGGSVVAHLKLGSFKSPLVRIGAADFLYSFDEYETYKNLRFLKKGGLCFVNLVDLRRFDNKVLDFLKRKRITFKAYDASNTASQMGSILSTNIVLIGYSAGTGFTPFKSDEFRTVLKEISPKKRLDRNLKAFERGFRDGKLSTRVANE